MLENFNKFFQSISSKLKHIAEGNFRANDATQFPDEVMNDSRLNELAETVNELSAKLQERELALEKTITNLENTLSDQRQLSLFFILYTLFISIFCFVSAYLNQTLSAHELDLVSPRICLAFLLFLIMLAIVQIKLSPFSLQSFGLTFQGSRRAIKESILATLPLIVIITLVRLWCTENVAAFQGKPFLNFADPATNQAFWIYLFIAPGQEFIARGVVQGLFFRLLGGKHAMFWSILLASLVFGVTHTYFSFWLSVLSVLGGFLWGWLYARHQTIVGVSISHFILGNYMLLTGFWSVLE